MTEMQIKSIAPWFGGKRQMAPRIAELLGPHTLYFEPFCGSAAVLFAKERSKQETINDLHRELINLAKVLRHPQHAPKLYHALQRVLFTDEVKLEASERLAELEPLEGGQPANLERAYWYFLTCWIGRSGTAGTERDDYQIAVRWTAGGGSPTIRFHSAVESIPAWHRRLSNVVILQRDAFEIIPRFDDRSHTAIYVDPPYMHRTRGEGGGGKYLHDFADNGDLFGDDHSHLVDQLNKFKHARIVVSYYDSPRVRELYAGWNLIDAKTTKNLANQNYRESVRKTAPELLITNFAVPTEE